MLEKGFVRTLGQRILNRYLEEMLVLAWVT